MPWSSEQRAIVTKVVTDVAGQVADKLGYDPEDADSFVKKIIEFLGENQANLGDVTYFLILLSPFDKMPAENEELSGQNIINKITSGTPHLFLDINTNIVEAKSGLTERKDASEISEKRKCLIYRVHGLVVDVYLDGKTIGSIYDIRYPEAAETYRHGLKRPMKDYKIIIDDHYQHSVRRGQETKHWANRRRRILRRKPEERFHNSLARWLKLFISGNPSVKRTAVDPAGDQTDIDVYVDGNSYVIEIKWLGQTDNHSYDRRQLDVGAEQLRIYLENDTAILLGVLVAYDGRDSSVHEAESWIQDCYKHCRGNYIVKFLESETASRAARRTVMRSSASKN